jgi:hypothetical protein
MNIKKIGLGLLYSGPIIAVSPFLIGLPTLYIGELFGYKVLGESGMITYKNKHIFSNYKYEIYDEITLINKYGKNIIKKDQNIVRCIGNILAPLPILPWLCMLTIPSGIIVSGIGACLCII